MVCLRRDRKDDSKICILQHSKLCRRSKLRQRLGPSAAQRDSSRSRNFRALKKQSLLQKMF